MARYQTGTYHLGPEEGKKVVHSYFILVIYIKMGHGTVVLHGCKTQGPKTYSMDGVWNIPSKCELC